MSVNVMRGADPSIRPSGQRGSQPAVPPSHERAEKSSEAGIFPTATTGSLAFILLMVGLFIVGLGLMFGFLPLTLIGLAVIAFAVLGWLLVTLIQSWKWVGTLVSIVILAGLFWLVFKLLGQII